MNKVRMGIIGIGVMGSRHALSLYAGDVENVKLTAVCDVKQSRLDWAKETFDDSVARYEKAEELMDSGLVDAVLIAVPHYMHAEYAIYALRHGLHTLTEKPAGVYTKQVIEMNEAAKESGKIFGIMYNQRTNPYFRKLKELVDTGELGQLRRMNWVVTNWYRSQSYYDSSEWRATWNGEGGGILINQCPHNLDMWQWICGMPSRIMAFCKYGSYRNIEVDDAFTMYAEYENGMTVTIVSTTGEPHGTNRLELVGDSGKVVIEEVRDNAFEFTYWKFAQSEPEFNAAYTGVFGEPDAKVVKFVPEDCFPYFDGHKKIIRNFANAILKGDALIAPGEEGLNAVEIFNACYLSSWENRWVELPVDAGRYLTRLDEKRKASARRSG